MEKVVLIKHSPSSPVYVFSVPEWEHISVGDVLICQTGRGEQTGTAVSEDFVVDKMWDNFSSLMGCKTLKPIVGKYARMMYNSHDGWVRESDYGTIYVCPKCGARRAFLDPRMTDNYCYNCGTCLKVTE